MSDSLQIGVGFSQSDLSLMAKQLNAISQNKSVKIGFHDGGMTGSLGRINGLMSEFDKSLAASNARVLAFGASAGAIFAVNKALKETVNATIDVEAQLTSINASLNLTKGGLASFGSQLYKIASDTGKSFGQVADAANELARQGLGVEETLKRTSAALILARRTGLDAADSVNAITAALNSSNNAFLEAADVVNKFVAVDQKFAVSSKDLAEAIKRVGSTASDAGVSLDELIGLVTAAQQTTSRGGAVIGNSFKTIFTRVENSKTQEKLEALGIATKKMSGESLSAIRILQNLATTYETLTDAQQAEAAQLVGGVYQVNILRASLKDLSKEYSVVGQATKIASGATDEAIRANAMLNTTLQSEIQRTMNSLSELAAQIGSQTFAPVFKDILKGFNDISGAMNGLGGGDAGADRISSGLKAAFAGPGIITAVATIVRLFGTFSGYAIEAFKVISGIGKLEHDRLAIEQQITNQLSAQPELVKQLLSNQKTVNSLATEYLNTLRGQALLAKEISRLAGPAASLVQMAGARVVSDAGGINKVTVPTRSGGHIPDMAEKMGAIDGGYNPGAIQKMNVPGIGQVVYNSAETVKYFGGKQPAIMPPEQSSAGVNYRNEFGKRHGFDPYAAGGMLPGMEGYSQYVMYDTLNGTVFPNKYKNAKSARLAAEKRNQNYGAIRFSAINKDSIKLKNFHERINNPFEASYRGETDWLTTVINPYASKGRIPNFAFSDLGSGKNIQNPYYGRNYKNEFDKKHGFDPYAAQGAVPNFARVLGSGAYGTFIDLEKRLKGRPIGVKRFSDYRSTQYDVENEYKMAKQLESLNINPLFYFPKTYGNLERSKLKSRIGKEVFYGATPAQIDLQHKAQQNGIFLRYPTREILKPLQGQLKDDLFNEHQIDADDFVGHSGNTVLNSKAQEIFNKITAKRLTAEKLHRHISGRPRLIKQVSNAIARQGGRLGVVDPGLFTANATEASPVFAAGLIPNFLPTNLLRAFRQTNKTLKAGKFNWADIGSEIGRYSGGKISISDRLRMARAGGLTADTLLHEGVHMAVNKAGFEGGISGVRLGKAFNDTDTARRVRNPSNGYSQSDYLEEAIADGHLFDNHGPALAKMMGMGEDKRQGLAKLYQKLKMSAAFGATKGMHRASGLIPAFAREAQSVNPSLIKVGKDSRLISASNPNGHGIYNMRDEPRGLGQGIDRAISEGRDPKTYNIPNFASPWGGLKRGLFDHPKGAGSRDQIKNFQASFLIPLLGGAIDPDGGPLSALTSGVGSYYSLKSFMPGKYGTAAAGIGAAALSGGGLIKSLANSGNKTNIEAESEKLKENFNKISDSLQKYTTTLEELNNATISGKSSSSDLVKLQAKLYNSVKDLPAEYQRQALAATNVSEAQEVLAKYAQQTEQRSRQLESAAKLSETLSSRSFRRGYISDTFEKPETTKSKFELLASQIGGSLDLEKMIKSGGVSQAFKGGVSGLKQFGLSEEFSGQLSKVDKGELGQVMAIALARALKEEGFINRAPGIEEQRRPILNRLNSLREGSRAAERNLYDTYGRISGVGAYQSSFANTQRQNKSDLSFELLKGYSGLNEPFLSGMGKISSAYGQGMTGNYNAYQRDYFRQEADFKEGLSGVAGKTFGSSAGGFVSEKARNTQLELSKLMNKTGIPISQLGNNAIDILTKGGKTDAANDVRELLRKNSDEMVKARQELEKNNQLTAAQKDIAVKQLEINRASKFGGGAQTFMDRDAQQDFISGIRESGGKYKSGSMKGQGAVGLLQNFLALGGSESNPEYLKLRQQAISEATKDRTKLRDRSAGIYSKLGLGSLAGEISRVDTGRAAEVQIGELLGTQTGLGGLQGLIGSQYGGLNALTGGQAGDIETKFKNALDGSMLAESIKSFLAAQTASVAANAAYKGYEKEASRRIGQIVGGNNAFGGIPVSSALMEKMMASAGGYTAGGMRKMGSGGVIYNSAESVVPFMGGKVVNPPMGSLAGALHKKNFMAAYGMNPYGLKHAAYGKDLSDYLGRVNSANFPEHIRSHLTEQGSRMRPEQLDKIYSIYYKKHFGADAPSPSSSHAQKPSPSSSHAQKPSPLSSHAQKVAETLRRKASEADFNANSGGRRGTFETSAGFKMKSEDAMRRQASNADFNANSMGRRGVFEMPNSSLPGADRAQQMQNAAAVKNYERAMGIPGRYSEASTQNRYNLKPAAYNNVVRSTGMTPEMAAKYDAIGASQLRKEILRANFRNANTFNETVSSGAALVKSGGGMSASQAFGVAGGALSAYGIYEGYQSQKEAVKRGDTLGVGAGVLTQAAGVGGLGAATGILGATAATALALPATIIGTGAALYGAGKEVHGLRGDITKQQEAYEAIGISKSRAALTRDAVRGALLGDSRPRKRNVFADLGTKMFDMFANPLIRNPIDYYASGDGNSGDPDYLAKKAQRYAAKIQPTQSISDRNKSIINSGIAQGKLDYNNKYSRMSPLDKVRSNAANLKMAERLNPTGKNAHLTEQADLYRYHLGQASNEYNSQSIIDAFEKKGYKLDEKQKAGIKQNIEMSAADQAAGRSSKYTSAAQYSQTVQKAPVVGPPQGTAAAGPAPGTNLNPNQKPAGSESKLNVNLTMGGNVGVAGGDEDQQLKINQIVQQIAAQLRAEIDALSGAVTRGEPPAAAVAAARGVPTRTV